MATANINLIPMERRLTQQRRQRFYIWIGAAVAWAGLLLAIHAGQRISFGGAGGVASADELPAVQNQISALNTKIAAVRKQLADARVIQQTALIVTDQPDWSILLSLLGSAINEDVVLRDINLKPLTAQRNQYTLEIHGLSRTQPGVSQLVVRLQQIGLFDEVKLLRTGREPILNSSAITFDLSCLMHDSGRINQP